MNLQNDGGSRLITLRRPENSDTFPEWMDLRIAARYSSISERKLRDWIGRPKNPLPATQVERGKLLINRHDMDRWLRAHPRRPHAVDLGRIVDDVVSEFRKAS